MTLWKLFCFIRHKQYCSACVAVGQLLDWQQCCQPCSFPANLGLFFFGVAGFFEDLLVACFWACFNWNLLVFWACFLQISVLRIAFLSNFMALVLFEFTAYWACFCKDLLILGLFFRICHPDSLFDFLANFSFCWIFLPTHFGLIFRLNYLFLACFSNLLACSWKITWRHWLAIQQQATQ